MTTSKKYVSQPDGTFKIEIHTVAIPNDPQMCRLKDMAAARPGSVVIGIGVHQPGVPVVESENYLDELAGGPAIRSHAAPTPVASEKSLSDELVGQADTLKDILKVQIARLVTERDKLEAERDDLRKQVDSMAADREASVKVGEDGELSLYVYGTRKAVSAVRELRPLVGDLQGLLKEAIQRQSDAACEYFILNHAHDSHALPALDSYAKSCEKEYPELAKHIREKWLGPWLTARRQSLRQQLVNEIEKTWIPADDGRPARCALKLRGELAIIWRDDTQPNVESWSWWISAVSSANNIQDGLYEAQRQATEALLDKVLNKLNV